MHVGVKLTIILKILKSENLYNSEYMCIWQLNITEVSNYEIGKTLN